MPSLGPTDLLLAFIIGITIMVVTLRAMVLYGIQGSLYPLQPVLLCPIRVNKQRLYICGKKGVGVSIHRLGTGH